MHKTVIYKDTRERKLIMERTFEAPRDLVWESWTQPEHVKQWWGPPGTRLLACDMDFHIGGVWRYVLRGADGVERTFEGQYQEIISPEQLVYSERFEDESGEATITLLFEELSQSKTKLTGSIQFMAIDQLNAAVASGMAQGMTETVDRLALYLMPSQSESKLSNKQGERNGNS